jgi:hypothetical protein
MRPTLAHVPWHWTSSTWTAVTALVLFGAAVVAAWQVIEARRLREATLRPFVVVDFEVESGEIYLAVSNIGKTMARDVRITFDRHLESAVHAGRDPNRLQQFEERLASGIATLPPGKSIRMLFDLSAQRTPEQNLTDRYTVTASYTADATNRRYENQTMDLDFGIYQPLVWINKKGVHEIAKGVEDLVATVKRWGGSSGLVVTTHDEERERFRAHEAWRRARQGRRLLRPYWRLRARLLHR